MESPVSPETAACRICDNTEGNRSFTAREMMFGFRDEFEYLECSACGCLQIVTIPDNIGRYYPDNYYSFKVVSPTKPTLRDLLLRQKTAYQIGRRNVLGWATSLLIKDERPWVRWVQKTGVTFTDAILDIGCGSGRLLLKMREVGFSDLLGVDPFIEEDIDYRNGVRVLRQTVDAVSREFDLVMMHHVFEHLPNPAETLHKVYRLLRPGRFALIRIPVADSYAWRTYGTNWVQLDAPRHFFLHTQRSMQLLAEAAGFEVTDVVHDSWDFQFWGSEQYIRDIPLHDPRSISENSEQAIFSADEIQQFAAKAAGLNRAGDGDAACFYLRKPEVARERKY